MTQLSSKINAYLSNNGKVYDDERGNFVLRDRSDGKGNFILSWNVIGLAQPTE